MTANRLRRLAIEVLGLMDLLTGPLEHLPKLRLIDAGRNHPSEVPASANGLLFCPQNRDRAPADRRAAQSRSYEGDMPDLLV
jgi:hypothetical protein